MNCLAIDHNDGRYLISGGADSSIRIWNLEEGQTNPILRPTASLTKATPSSHTHALTSLSIYPFDPVPSTILTTAYDLTLKLSSITPSGIKPVHSFDLGGVKPYSHSLSSHPASNLLIAVGASHPAVRLLDLRSTLATHSLPGHTGAILSVCWSPKSEHVLAAASSSGAVLLFDVRRSNAAFANLDHDDAIGVLPPEHTPDYSGRAALDWNAKAHNAPVTGVRWTPDGRHMVTCGHDQRIRIWDSVTGKNELVHFGPRVRNSRYGEFNPLLSPLGFASKHHREVLLWANDDAKGEIFMFDLNEGAVLKTLRVLGIARDNRQSHGGRKLTTTERMTGAGRINAMVWRANAGSGSGVEMYSGHGDGSIQAWMSQPDGSDDDVAETSDEVQEEELRKKRKRDVLGEIVEGLTKRPVTYN